MAHRSSSPARYVDGRVITLGRFHTIEEATAARLAAERAFWK